MRRFTYDAREQKSAEGFTLIEVLVAILILTTVVFVPVSIIAQHLSYNVLTERNVQANLLAQEIIEYVRYSRDSNLLNATSVGSGTLPAGAWFEEIHDKTSARNEYRFCITSESEWADSGRQNNPTQLPFCNVLCLENAVRSGQTAIQSATCGDSDASTVADTSDVVNGFVSGVSAVAGARGTTPDTCDNNSAKPNETYTATLTVIIPRQTDLVQYAMINPCVSWKDRNGKVQKVELTETMFEWVAR